MLSDQGTQRHEEGTYLDGDRGVTFCRSCDSTNLTSVLDLGFQPLSNRLLPTPSAPCPLYPLHLRICTSCLLGQVGEVVEPNEIFTDYPYLSSVSSSWLEHMDSFARRVSPSLETNSEDFILEVASNDGYLLKSFRDLGHSVLGVEPAGNVAAVAEECGIPTIVEFFGRQLAIKLRESRGYPTLVVANNVLAHVPDLDDFMGGLALICGPATRISIENPSFLTLMQGLQFDTIYHEHYSYLSVHAVRRLAARHGLVLFNVESLPTHGGSYRYWISRPDSFPVSPDVEVLERIEISGGLGDSSLWNSFATATENVVDDLRKWLLAREGSQVAAFGAAAKGNTLLNAVGDASHVLKGVFDGSPEKIGLYLPGTKIPVWDRAQLSPGDWSDILILPWNLATEISLFVGSIDNLVALWRSVPRLERISPDAKNSL